MLLTLQVAWFIERTGRDVTRQQQQVYVHVWQTRLFKIKVHCLSLFFTHSAAEHCSAVCTKETDSLGHTQLFQGGGNIV